MHPETTPDFYRTHSPMSDPGTAAPLLAHLPQDDLGALCRIVQTVYRHYYDSTAFPLERRQEVDLRRAERLWQRIAALDARPLTEPRPPEQRLIGCCRDAALLLCSMLRQQGIPARLRVGFAAYIRTVPGFHVDHVVLELWDSGRWHLVDAEQDAGLIAANDIQFSVHDIPRDQFLAGGQAWLAVRDGRLAAADFGADPQEHFWRGEWAIRQRLLQDALALNKIEYLLWDTWGLMEGDAPAGHLGWLDTVAALTTRQEIDFAAVRALAQDARLKPPERFMTYSPVRPFYETTPDTL
ncbi:MAG: transglutaminase domain-containing protein [Anaerolineae bacterium]|jgi:hypothetical protein|nr:transglutaminase domain-containing protein [Anaerolineae bacterium]